MELPLHAQLITVGLSVGCIYVLVALGFLLIYNGVGALNFAQGDLVMLGAFAGVALGSDAGLALPLAFVLTGVALSVVGYALGRCLYSPIRDKHFTVFLIASVGFSIFLSNAAQIVWGPSPRNMPSFTGDRTVAVGGAVLPVDYLVVTLASLLTLVALYALFSRTFIGRQLRAVATDRQTAELVGIHVGRATTAVFVLSAVVSGVAGFLIAPVFFAVATMGPPLAIKAFVAIVVGGFGNMLGAVIGGLMVGLMESYVGYYISSAYKEAIIYGVLIAVLLFLPQGVLGEKIEEKV